MLTIRSIKEQVEIENILRKIHKLIKEKNENTRELNKFKNSKNNIMKIEKKLYENSREIKNKEDALDNITEKKDDIKKLIDNNENIQKYKKYFKKVTELEENISNNKKELKKLRDKEIELKTEINDNRKTIKKIESDKEELDEKKHELGLYVSYTSATGRSGAPAVIFSRFLPILQNQTNKLLEEYSNFNIKLLYDTKNKTEDYRAIKIQINKPDSVKNMSANHAGGFEKALINVCIRIACAKLASIPISTLFILDETFGCADKKNQVKIKTFLEKIKNEFDVVLIISHNDVKDYADDMIDIDVKKIKGKKYSHVDFSDD